MHPYVRSARKTRRNEVLALEQSKTLHAGKCKRPDFYGAKVRNEQALEGR